MSSSNAERDLNTWLIFTASVVCPSVRLSQAGIAAKLLNTESRKQRRTITLRYSSFLMPKMSAKLDHRPSLQGSSHSGDKK